MDRSRAIDRLAKVLTDAGAAADWALLGAAVRELGPQLQALGANRPWSVQERGALARLRAAHEGAADAVAAESSRLQVKMDEMTANKEGWMAYALAGEHDTGSTER